MSDKTPRISEDTIRLRSYQIWQEEGCPVGRALAHWLQAKAELEAQWQGDPPRRRRSSLVKPRVSISVKPTRRSSGKVTRES